MSNEYSSPYSEFVVLNGSSELHLVYETIHIIINDGSIFVGLWYDRCRSMAVANFIDDLPDKQYQLDHVERTMYEVYRSVVRRLKHEKQALLRLSDI